jgi:hypothetical protein
MCLESKRVLYLFDQVLVLINGGEEYLVAKKLSEVEVANKSFCLKPCRIGCIFNLKKITCGFYGIAPRTKKYVCIGAISSIVY